MPEVRLIDGAALEKEIDDAMKQAHDQFNFVAAQLLAIVKQSVQEQPTIKAAPVRNGTWKYGYNPDVGILCYFCSACGKEAYWDTDYGQQRFDFCPNCGARMDGGAENGNG